jgi:hypothetical protein
MQVLALLDQTPTQQKNLRDFQIAPEIIYAGAETPGPDIDAADISGISDQDRVAEDVSMQHALGRGLGKSSPQGTIRMLSC